MPAPLDFLRAQIAEIEHDDALRWYGVAMAFLHVVTYLYWVDQRIVTFVSAQAEPICWPLAPACENIRVLSAAGVALLLRAYFAAAISAGLLFAFRRLVPWAYAGLVLVNVLKLAVMLLDYRLRMNQHYMGFFVTFAYLFVPGKRDALRVLVTLFYFWAGSLKLNWEWISGAGLYRPLWPFSGDGVVVACAYVIVLELGLAWGLLAQARLDLLGGVRAVSRVSRAVVAGGRLLLSAPHVRDPVDLPARRLVAPPEGPQVY